MSNDEPKPQDTPDVTRKAPLPLSSAKIEDGESRKKRKEETRLREEDIRKRQSAVVEASNGLAHQNQRLTVTSLKLTSVVGLISLGACLAAWFQGCESRKSADLALQTLNQIKSDSASSSKQFQVQLQHFDAGLGRTGQLAAAADRQADKTKEIAENSRFEFKATQRAFIFVKSMDTSIGFSLDGRRAYSWEMLLANGGNTNARALVVERSCGTLEQFKIRLDQRLNFSKIALVKQHLTVGPHSDQRVQNCATGISSLKPGTFFLIFGRITYKDIFDVRHLTEFCYQHSFHMPTDGDFGGSVYMTPCEGANASHNCTDEDCKS